MIKPTDEMERVAQDAYESGESWRSVVIVVLALVERDYEVRPYCGEESGVPGVRCRRMQHGDQTQHYAVLPHGSGMSW